jgi:hypothetical protein
MATMYKNLCGNCVVVHSCQVATIILNHPVYGGIKIFKTIENEIPRFETGRNFEFFKW